MNPFLARLIFSVWAMEKQHADAQFPLFVNSLKGSATNPGEARQLFRNSLKVGFATQSQPYDISEYGELSPPEKAPKNSVAIVNFTDTLTKYDQFCSAGAITKSNIIQRIDANPNIIGIVLKADGPGGEGSAARILNDTIKNVKNKPTVGYIDDLAASAHFYFLTGADHLYANTKQALVGSVGTYITIADYPGYYESLGLKTMEIYADASSEKNQDYWQAIEYMRTDGKKGSLDGIKKLVNTFNDQFLADVKENRGHALKGNDAAWNKGQLKFADEALKDGLIDGIDSLENVIAKFY